MKSLLLSLLRKVYLDEFATTTWKKLRQTAHRILWHRKRGFGRVDQVLIKTYLAQHSVRKLQIGILLNNRLLTSDLPINVAVFPAPHSIAKKIVRRARNKELPLR